MPTTTGLSAEQLQKKIDELKAQGKDVNTSKSLGKYVDALKLLKPEGFRASDIAQAQAHINNSTQPGSSNDPTISGGGTSMGTGSSGVNLNDIYNTALNDPALKALEEELTSKKTARDTAEADINDNPYYAEATRVGKITKLNQRANNEISTLQSQIDSKKADAQIKVNIATQQYNIDDKNYQNNIQKLNMLISSGAITGASSTDLANIAVATGISTSMLQGIVAKAKTDAIKPQIGTETDNNGNVTVYAINPQTGEKLYTTSIGGIGKTKDTGDGTTNTNKYLTQAVSVLKQVDTMNYGTEDKMLSSWEANEAYNRILSLVKGDSALADATFKQAVSYGGYSSWGQ